MRIPFGALAFALLLSLASAQQFEAYFSENSSVFYLQVFELAYPGHYGGYNVSIRVSPYPSSVRVSGEEASQSALANEIGRLANERVLETSCDPSRLLIASWSSSYCSNTGQWADCAQEPACAKPSPISQPAGAPGIIPAVGSAAKEMSQQAYDGSTPLAPSLGAATEAQRKASQEGGIPPEPAITLDQLIPLLGIFVAAVVASYLILQQRQVTEQLDPQSERLLENETRAGIMEELESADKIPTDLSAKLGKSKATIVEHLETLLEAGFVEKLATPGKKFVFYRLTRKGKQALLRRAG